MLNNIIFLSPEFFLIGAIVTLLVYGTIYEKIEGKFSQLFKITWLSILSLLFTAFIIYSILPIESIYISNNLLYVDSLILYVKIIVILTGISILLLSLKYQGIPKFEYNILILLAILGIMVLISSNDFIMFYLGIELFSLSLYVLAGLKTSSSYSTEAALKYFILGALSSGLLLIGISLIYTFIGSTNFDHLKLLLWYGQSDLAIIGAMFIIISLLFKLAAAPFHMWAPDVYEGSPNIVTAFFAIVPKIAILSILISVLFGPFLGIFSDLQPIILFSGVLSIIIGSFGALNQSKIKRLLAYSAVGHMGFMLIGILPGSFIGLQATLVYIILYIIMSVLSFTAILSFYKGTSNFISQLSGISRTAPVFGLTFALGFLSIAGIPPLAGFLSKYLVILSAVNSSYYVVALIAVLSSVVGAFYYLRVVKWIYFKDSSDFIYKDLGDVALPSLKIPFINSLLLGISLYLILTLLIYPQPLMVLTFNSISTSLL